MEDLLALFDGSLDADSAFFGRTVQVDGDTGAVVALHNALEAANLSMTDLLGLPLIDQGFRMLQGVIRRSRQAEMAR